MSNYNTNGVIYCIRNKANNKRYIGMTTRDAKTRFAEHCKADSYIGNAIRKHGGHNFVLHVIDQANDIEELKEKEIYWIREYNSFVEGYNQTHGGDGIDQSVYIEVVLDNKQKAFLNWVKKENKKQLNIHNGYEVVESVLINLMEFFLTADKEKDKRESARMLAKLKPEYKMAVLEAEVFTEEYLYEWL